jgi:hypothetical protein
MKGRTFKSDSSVLSSHSRPVIPSPQRSVCARGSLATQPSFLEGHHGEVVRKNSPSTHSGE